jgi:hypothetical protein
VFKNTITIQAWWHMPIIPAFGKLRLEYLEFRAILDYVVRPASPNKTKT